MELIIKFNVFLYKLFVSLYNENLKEISYNDIETINLSLLKIFNDIDLDSFHKILNNEQKFKIAFKEIFSKFVFGIIANGILKFNDDVLIIESLYNFETILDNEFITIISKKIIWDLKNNKKLIMTKDNQF